MKLLSGPSLGVSEVIVWSKVGSLSGPSLFLTYFIVVSSDFVKHSVIILCFFVPNYLAIY